MKKYIFVLAVVTICVALMASGTLAFFSAEDTAHNVITSGAVAIEVEEWQLAADGTTLELYPNDYANGDQPILAMPGISVSKIPTVKNLEQPAYVRARAVISIVDKNNAALPHDKIIAIDYNTTEWTLKDGWYYYNAALQPDTSTKPLFTTVTFSGPDMDNTYQGCSVNIDVQAQAVQAANNTDSALTANGWSAE